MVVNKFKLKFINRSLIVFAILLFLISSVLFLHFKEVIQFNQNVINILMFFLMLAVVITLTSLLLRFTVNHIYKLFEKDLEIEQRILLAKLYTIFIYAIAVGIILYYVGVGLSDITLYVGLITTGIALAVRDIIMSFFIWLIVLTKKPFRIGDVITSADDTGIVDRIGNYYITLIVIDGKETHKVKVPNKMLLDRNLRNHGKNKISGDLRLAIVNIPDDPGKFVSDIASELKDSHVDIEVDEKDYYLSIRYVTDYPNDKDFRLKMLSHLIKTHRKYLV